jgi:carbonic anhydrase
MFLCFIAVAIEVSKLKNKEKATFLSVQNEEPEAKKDSQGDKPVKEEKNSKSPYIKENLEGWFRIQSMEYTKSNIFPPILLPSGRKAEFKFTGKGLLYNSFYNKEKQDENNPPFIDSFYIKTNKNLVYFSATKNSSVVLSAFKVTEASNINRFTNFYCVDLRTEEFLDKHSICGRKREEILPLMCSLKDFCSQELPLECNGGAKIEETKEENLDNQEITKDPIFIIPEPARYCNDGWNYNNKGSDWECICSEGFEQSPIELPSKEEAIHADAAPYFYFSPVTSHQLKISYNENAVEVNLAGDSNYATITTLNGGYYVGKKLRFHTPAEHIIKGQKPADLEMEIIYEGVSKGDLNKQVVLSFLFKSSPGKKVPFFEFMDISDLPSVFFPEEKSINISPIPYIQYELEEKEQEYSEAVKEAAKQDPLKAFELDKEEKKKAFTSKKNGLKPFSFYTYQGSLSAPPCTERTIRYVASEIIPLSTTVIELFKDALVLPNDAEGGYSLNLDEENLLNGESKEIKIEGGKAKENVRAPQNLNGRQVFYWDRLSHCGVPEKLEEEIEGHYEAIRKKITRYYHLTGTKPSGLPGAFVVSEKEARGITEH